MNPLHKKAQKTKLEKQLTKSQLDQLFRWLTKDELSYKAAIERLQKDFGVQANLTNLNKFYHRTCVPRLIQQQEIAPDPGVLLDVLIKRRKDNSFQVQILQRNKSVALVGSKNVQSLDRTSK